MNAKVISSFDALLMLTLILFWGSSFVVVKVLLRGGLTPIAIATSRFLVASGLFSVVLILRKNRKSDYGLRMEKKDVPMVLLLALTGVTLFFTAQYTGIQMAGASIAAILVCLLSPILIAIFSARIFKERLMKNQVLGIAAAAAGTFTVIAGGTLSVQNGASFLLGSLILLSTPFLWTTYSLLGKKTMEKYDAFLVVAYVNMLGGLCLVPFSWAEGSLNMLVTLDLSEWAAILFLSSTCSLLGYYIWFYVLKRVHAAVTSSFLFAEPLITALFAIAFVGETLNPLVVAGGFLIFAGVCLVTRR
jgi:drug/metabolite transporter (DMT)-like permease